MAKREYVGYTNIAFITLPSKDWWENRMFLQNHGITAIGGKDFFPAIHTGCALRHTSGIIAKVVGRRTVTAGKNSCCSRIELQVINSTCPREDFQKVFYDFFGDLIR